MLPSGTEIIHALGLGSFQVGRSHECDFPPCVTHLPVCSRVNIDVSGTSAAIDRLVKDRAAVALSIYDLDADLIRTLRPTHILTQTQCNVCAVNLADVQRAVWDLAGTGTSLLSVQPYCLADVWKDIASVGEACDAAGSATNLITRLQERWLSISETAARSERRPAVAVIEWLDPLMAAGNWIPELVAMANGQNLYGEAGRHSPFLAEEEFFRADPPVILVAACGFGIERSLAELRAVALRPEWQHLRAMQADEVYVCDGNQYLSRPGPRLVQSLRILAEILHPQLFAPTLEGSGWVRIRRSGT